MKRSPAAAVLIGLSFLVFAQPESALAQAVREAYVKASNADAFDKFGNSVAISGTTAVVGALFESSGATGVGGNQADNSTDVAGAAYVFVRGASTWTQQAYLKASNTDSYDGFGRVVAISGDTIAVGARGESSAATTVNGDQADNSADFAGAVYIFVRSGSVWTQQAYIKASDAAAGQNFGSAVSLEGDVLAVGANSRSGAPGAVYIFRRTGTTWAQEARLQPLDVAAQGLDGLEARDFGNTVSLSADSVAVPAPAHSNLLGPGEGVVYIFRRSAGIWSQEAMLIERHSFGPNAALSGSTLAIGIPPLLQQNTSFYGAHFFTRSGTSWTYQGLVSEEQSTTGFATTGGMAMQGDVLLLGGTERVWAYARSGSSWVKTATFDALDASRSDFFGQQLAVSGGRAIIAAPNEDSTTTGINGPEGGIGATQSGAIYLYSGLGPQSVLDLAVTVDQTTTAICKEATLTLTLSNRGQQVITSVEAPAGLVLVGTQVATVTQTQTPPGAFSLTAGQSKVLTWKIMGTKAGTATYDIRYQGRLNGAELVQSAIIRAPAVVFSGLELEVNSTGDEADADLADNCPDVDLTKPGLQSTLRSVLQTVNATTLPAGQRVRVSFAIPGTGVPRIAPLTPLPAVAKPAEILGNAQASGWVELNGARASGLGDGLEVRSPSTVRGLVVNGWKRAGLVLTGSGGHEVLGCRLGTDAAGATAVPNGFGVVVLSPDNVVGGTGSLGNLISGNLVSGVSLEKLTTGGLPNGNRIIGNRIGTTADGTQTVLQKSGVVVANGADNIIGDSGLGNLISGHKLVGVSIEGSDSKGNRIQANLVGTTADGSAALPNNIGIALSKGASANTIGGDAGTLGNLISGNNASGVLITEAAFSNKIQGNVIGLNRNGTLALANVVGVYIEDGISNRIGGGIASHKNVISGNTSAGITLSNSKGAVPQQRSCNGTIIEGNWIGLSKDGLHTVPNGGPMPLSNAGIVLNYYAQNTTIGGTLPGQRNVISGNAGFGVGITAGPGFSNLVLGNFIGVLPDGTSPAGNTGSGVGTGTASSAQCIIGGSAAGAGNRIAYNQGHGVDLRGVAPTVASPVLANEIFLNTGRAIALADRRPVNDNGDADTGPNGLQNHPFLRTARNLSGATSVLMDLKSFPLNKTFRIDFFHQKDGDPQSGGDAWISALSLLTGTVADALYVANLPLQFSGSAITCTATDTTGNTSEFSNPVIVSAAADRDHDGIPDDQETAGGKVPTRTRNFSLGDANGDGIPDADQANVSTMLLSDTGWSSLAGPAGSSLTNLGLADYAGYARLPSPWQTRREIVTFNLASAPAGTTTMTWIEAPGSEVQQIWRWSGSAWLSASPVITVDDASGTRRFTVTLPTPLASQLVSLARAYTPPPLPVMTISSNPGFVPAAQVEGTPALPGFGSFLDPAPATPAPLAPTALVPATSVILLLTPPDGGIIQWSRDLGATERWQDIFPPARLTPGRFKFTFPYSEPHGFFRLRSTEN